jgi:hypothetical protein
MALTGEVAHRHEADGHLRGPGTAVLVHRGVHRSVVIACPDGCGDTLTVNLDGRSGPAWRFYSDRQGMSLYPSVWRDSGCRSHFIVWHSRIYWCDWKEDALDEDNAALENRVRDILTPALTPYATLADRLGEVPWAVLVACNRLVSKHQAIEGKGANRGKFRRS